MGQGKERKVYRIPRGIQVAVRWLMVMASLGVALSYIVGTVEVHMANAAGGWHPGIGAVIFLAFAIYIAVIDRERG